MLHNDDQTREHPCLPERVAAVRHFAAWTERWHAEEPTPTTEDNLLQQLHFANFTLWHLEDAARDPAATSDRIAEIKRAIDHANQLRNNHVERFDVELLAELAESDLPAPEAPLHSETPGMMADRLSILALKLFHTADEAERADADEVHRQRNRQRLLVLQQQNDDLLRCLEELFAAVQQRLRGYRLYRQMKMYNDPDLNPILYRSSRQA